MRAIVPASFFLLETVHYPITPQGGLGQTAVALWLRPSSAAESCRSASVVHSRVLRELFSVAKVRIASSSSDIGISGAEISQHAALRCVGGRELAMPRIVAGAPRQQEIAVMN